MSDAPDQITRLWDLCDRKPVGRGAVRLTSDMVERFCDEIRKGNYLEVAAHRLGFTKGQMYKWRHRGRKELEELEKGERESVTLCAVLTAEADRASADLHDALIQDVLACDDPKLKFEFMRRRWSKIYSGNPNAVEDPDTGETQQVDVAAMLLEKLSALRGDVETP